MRRHRVFLVATALEVLILGGLLGWCRLEAARHDEQSLPAQRQLVRTLGLTDLALWTEARYTRHPSQADRFAAFQDAPGGLEHFPAGSIVAPPDRWRAEVPTRRSRIAWGGTPCID